MSTERADADLASNDDAPLSDPLHVRPAEPFDGSPSAGTQGTVTGDASSVGDRKRPISMAVPKDTERAKRMAMARKLRLQKLARRAAHARGHGQEGAAQPEARSEINVTPLVDVVLVLLIIFMVVTPMLHRGVDLELPASKHHSKRQDTGEQIVLSVRADGAFIEANRIEHEQLAEALRKELKGGRPVNVRAERSLRFGEVRKVLEQVHAAGAPNVNMETQERTE